MLHYITIHHRSQRWIDIQLRHIDYFSTDYLVWSLFSRDLDISDHKDKFHYIDYKIHPPDECASLDHWRALDTLTNTVCSWSTVNDDDILIFIDSDVLPISNVNDYINKHINQYQFCAINRIENLECLAPHPSFAFCTVDFWKKHKLSWDGDLEKGRHWGADTGGNMYFYFEENNIDWLRIHRDSKNSLFSDPLLYSVYENIAYHHGAGSRGTFQTRCTPQFMYGAFDAPKKRREFFTGIYEQLDDYIFKAINNGYFIKKDQYGTT